jgi:hypothetical protein
MLSGTDLYRRPILYPNALYEELKRPRLEYPSPTSYEIYVNVAEQLSNGGECDMILEISAVTLAKDRSLWWVDSSNPSSLLEIAGDRGQVAAGG